MSAPCINDTCSIEAVIDSVTRRLSLNVLTNLTGSGISCDNGLKVDIYGDPADADPIDLAFQQLGRSDAGPGELWSIPKRAKAFYRAGDVVNIPQAAGAADPSSDSLGTQTIINPFASPAEMIVLVQHRIGYTISDTFPDGDHGHPVITDGSVSGGDGGIMVPYGAQVECRVDGIGASGNFNDAVIFADIGGVVPSLLNNSHRRHISYGVSRRTILAGETIQLTATANHRLTAAGDVHWFNVNTVNAGDAPVFAERGYRASVYAIILPFGSEEL